MAANPVPAIKCKECQNYFRPLIPDQKYCTRKCARRAKAVDEERAVTEFLELTWQETWRRVYGR